MSWLDFPTPVVRPVPARRCRPGIERLEDRLCPTAAALAAPVIPTPALRETTVAVQVVTGAGFVPGCVVLLNGRALATAFVSSTELMAFIPRITRIPGGGPRHRGTVRIFTLDDEHTYLITVFTPGVGTSLPVPLFVRGWPHTPNPGDPPDVV
jgi:hypothetical protein